MSVQIYISLACLLVFGILGAKCAPSYACDFLSWWPWLEDKCSEGNVAKWSGYTSSCCVVVMCACVLLRVVAMQGVNY